MRAGFTGWRIGQQRGEVVVENERPAVGGITDTAGAFIARTQITRRVIIRQRLVGLLLYLSLPWTLCTMRRDQQPLTGEKVQAAVRAVEHKSLLRGWSWLRGERGTRYV